MVMIDVCAFAIAMRICDPYINACVAFLTVALPKIVHRPHHRRQPGARALETAATRARGGGEAVGVGAPDRRRAQARRLRAREQLAVADGPRAAEVRGEAEAVDREL